MAARKRSGLPMTIKQVADHLGVAQSSVSRALNDHPDVSEEMKQRVRLATEELGYEPDYMAQSLRRGATKTVGFVLRDISNPLFADLVIGASIVLNSAGYSLLLMNSDQDPEQDVGHIKLFRQRRVDGLILSLQSETQPGLIQLAANLDFPIVLVDRELPGVAASSVVVDNYTGMERAVQHLISLGHRRIALVSGSEDILTTRERLRGYRAAMQANGLPEEADLLRLRSYDQQWGYEQSLNLLTQAAPPTAIIAGGIRLLVGTLSACREASVRVGHDVSIVGCDEAELMSYLDPAISVILRHPRTMGKLAAELLLERLEPDAQPRSVMVPTEYVPRASTMPPSTPGSR
jgi:LacI family transcriptional regulator, galactose operon repressor